MIENGLFRINTQRFIIQFVSLLVLFSWLQISLIYISKTLNLLQGSYIERILIYGAYHLPFVAMSIVYSNFSKMYTDKYSLHLWFVLTTVSSLISIFTAAIIQCVFISIILSGVTLGVGVPYCLSNFADNTETENRGKIGGILFLLMSPTIPLFSVYAKILDLYSFSVFSTIWILVGFILLLLLKKKKMVGVAEKRIDLSLFSILANKQFYLYFIAWAVYSLIDNFGASILNLFLQGTFGSSLRDFLLNISAIFMAFSVVIIGFLIDVYGRKLPMIFGFVALGISYAFIGINPLNMVFWYLYFIVSGIASGFFVILFVFTLWGDISPRGAREKYYAVGSLPFFFMVFIREIMAPYTAAIPVSTAFSFASFFLFLAVLPLIYAPETLPEREIRRRELRDYIKKAKKMVGKH